MGVGDQGAQEEISDLAWDIRHTGDGARAHDVAAMSIRGDSTVLNFPALAGLLPHPTNSTPRNVQAAAVKAAHMDHLDPLKPRRAAKSVSSSSASLASSPSSSSLVSTITSGEDASTPPQDEEEDAAAPPSPTELGEIVELPELQVNAEPTRDEFIFVDSYGWDFCHHPWSHLDDCGYYATVVAGDWFDTVLSGDF